MGLRVLVARRRVLVLRVDPKDVALEEVELRVVAAAELSRGLDDLVEHRLEPLPLGDGSENGRDRSPLLAQARHLGEQIVSRRLGHSASIRLPPREQRDRPAGDDRLEAVTAQAADRPPGTVGHRRVSVEPTMQRHVADAESVEPPPSRGLHAPQLSGTSERATRSADFGAVVA